LGTEVKNKKNKEEEEVSTKKCFKIKRKEKMCSCTLRKKGIG
jgi:hypothetical protein